MASGIFLDNPCSRLEPLVPLAVEEIRIGNGRSVAAESSSSALDVRMAKNIATPKRGISQPKVRTGCHFQNCQNIQFLTDVGAGGSCWIMINRGTAGAVQRVARFGQLEIVIPKENLEVRVRVEN